jgi:glycosyltransferase involved in cell wall biosynthesis
MNQKISAVIITKNEESSIKKVITSVQWCDEIIIVDSLSTDQTCSIAKECGATVISQSFLGFGLQKKFAVSQASNSWILSVDADEIVTPELAVEIRDTVDQSNPETAFKIPRTLVFMNKIFKFSGEHKRPVLRLFHRNYFNFNDSPVHEEVVGSGKVHVLKCELLHYSYKNWNDYLEKMNLYTSKMASKLYCERKDIKYSFLKIRVFLAFLQVYVLKLGILDGIQGFLWAFSCSFAKAMKYAKYQELKMHYHEQNQNKG